MGDLYVVVTWENGSPQLCYDIGRVPFIGPLQVAIEARNDLMQGWPDHKYAVAKLEFVDV